MLFKMGAVQTRCRVSRIAARLASSCMSFGLPRLVGRPRVHAHGSAAVSLLPVGHPRHVRPFARMCTVPAVSTPCAGSLSLDSGRCGGIFIRRVSIGACKARRGRVSKLLCMPIPIKRWSMSDPIAAAEAANKARDIANRFRDRRIPHRIRHRREGRPLRGRPA